MKTLDPSTVPTEILKRNIRCVAVEIHDLKKMITEYEQRPRKSEMLLSTLQHELWCAQNVMPIFTDILIERLGMPETDKIKKIHEAAEQARKIDKNKCWPRLNQEEP